MKPSFTGKTLFVPRHCLDEVEKLIVKRRRQHLIESLDHIYTDKSACAKLKSVIDATCEKAISMEDCQALINRAATLIPKQTRELMTGGIAYKTDYLEIYKWHCDGEKQSAFSRKPLNKLSPFERKIR